MTTDFLHRNIRCDEPVIIRALGSITRDQTDTIIQALSNGDQAWRVRVDYDYDGYGMILIERDVSCATSTSFFVSGTSTCLNLYQTERDDLVLIGMFSSTSELTMFLSGIVRHGLGTSKSTHDSA